MIKWIMLNNDLNKYEILKFIRKYILIIQISMYKKKSV